MRIHVVKFIIWNEDLGKGLKVAEYQTLKDRRSFMLIWSCAKKGKKMHNIEKWKVKNKIGSLELNEFRIGKGKP